MRSTISLNLVGRPETPIDPQAGPLPAFAADLRLLRSNAGGISYRRLARRTHFSESTLARAADGRHQPSLALVLAYVRACGGDEAFWREKWRRLIRELTVGTAGTADLVAYPGALVPEAAVPHQLPPDVRDFVGRAAHLSRIRASVRLPDAASPVWAIAGLPGVGKTAFAVHVAHLLSGLYPDGQLFADLRGADEHPVPSGQVVARFTRALGSAGGALPPDADELTACYRSRLAGRRCLLLLDNAADEDQVRPLIPAGSSCLVLITSRNRLAGLASGGGRFIALDPLTEQDASRLLASTAPAGTDWSEPAARELIRICGRLPLALRITGAQLATGTTASAGELGDRLLAMETRLARLEIGNLGVRTSFALSYLRLPTLAKTVFRRLGLFPGPTLTAPIAAQLAGLDAEQAAQALHLLQQRSLLSLTGTGRYELHDLLRLYADGCSQAEDTEQERTAARLRLADWMLAGVAGAATSISPASWHVATDVCPTAFGGYDAALAWLDAEHANLSAAVSWLHGSSLHQHAWQIAVELWHWFNLRGHHAELISTAMTGQVCARLLGDSYAEAVVLQSLALGYVRSRRFADALRAQQRALNLFRETGNRPGEARVLGHLGITYCHLGRTGEAITALTRSARLHRKLNDSYGVGLAYSNLAWVQDDHCGNSDAAVRWCHRALTAFGDNPYGRSLVLTNLASAYRRLGRLDCAVSAAEQAVRAHNQTGFREGEAVALEHLAQALSEVGDTEAARRYWARSLTAFRSLQDPRQEKVASRLASLPASPGHPVGIGTSEIRIQLPADRAEPG